MKRDYFLPLLMGVLEKSRMLMVFLHKGDYNKEQ